jgi:hypothetical protein
MADKYDAIFLSMLDVKWSFAPLLACLYTGPLPGSCGPMPRDPLPATGTVLDETVMAVLKDGLERNPTIHDGAVMFGRGSADKNYAVTGWSYRLFPPDGPLHVEPNFGSAFNSALCMSLVSGVDRLYSLGHGELRRFDGGRVWKVLTD